MIYKHTSKYIIATYFDTKLSMFGLAPSAMEEGAPQELEGGVQSALNF